MSSAKHIFVVIVNYINWQDTLECTRSLLSSAEEKLSIIIADNASGNKSLEQLRDSLGSVCFDEILPSRQLPHFFTQNEWPRVLLVSHHSNAGFAATNNLVINALLHKDAWIWLLNPDMIVQADTAGKLAAFASSKNELTVTGCIIKSWHDKNRTLIYGGGRVNWNTGTVTENTSLSSSPGLDYISGASMFCHLSCFRAAGLLPEEYFLVWEETDWCRRATIYGIQLAVCDDAVCYDKVSTVLGKGFLAQYYYTRNGLYFISRYKKKKLQRVLFASLLRFVLRVVTGRWKQAGGVWKGIRDFQKNKMHALE